MYILLTNFCRACNKKDGLILPGIILHNIEYIYFGNGIGLNLCEKYLSITSIILCYLFDIYTYIQNRI